MSEDGVPPSDLMEALMKDPVKKKLLLELLRQNKDGFEAYKRREKNTVKTPTSLKKNRIVYCESPTALQRRRALEKLHQSTTSEESSAQSEVSVEPEGLKLPFEKLLEGVTAYVEIKRNNVDRSEGVKAVMRLMGATVMEEFTNNVTHVIFKDGSFQTYQKAKLMKVHFVSVLWLDAVRRTHTRVSEKKYPAFGNSNLDEGNASMLCSQLQKDYEDVIKDEKSRRSLHNTSRINPSRNKNKRHTIMISQLSQRNVRKSTEELFSEEDLEVERILQGENELLEQPDLTSDDSDCGVIDGQSSKRSKDEITDDLSDRFAVKETTNVSSSIELSDSRSLLPHIKSKKKRQTVNVVTDMVLTPNMSEEVNETNKMLQPCNSNSAKKSSRISSESDRTKSGLDGSKLSTKSTSKLENCPSKNTIETTMSSLRLSDSFNDKIDKLQSLEKTNQIKCTNKRNQRKTICSMSSLTRSDLNLNSRDSGESDRSSKLELDVLDSEELKTKRSGRSSMKQTSNRTKSNRRKTCGKIVSEDESLVEDDNLRKPKNVNTKRSISMQKSNTPKKGKNRKSEIQKGKRTQIEDSLSMEEGTSIIESENEDISDKEVNSNNVKKKVSSDSIKNNKDKSNLETSPSPSKKIRIEKKTRKLYNPDATIQISRVESDVEREEYLKNKLKTKSNETSPNENDVHISPLKPQNNSKKIQVSNEKVKKPKKPMQKLENKTRETDTQRDLLTLLTEKNDAVKNGQSPKDTFKSGLSSTISNVPISPIKRRSTLDFQSISQSQQKRKLTFNSRKNSSIVCTKMHRPEVLSFQQTVKELGFFFVEDKVTDKTTHLVAGEYKRTINMLRALARGCWILKHEWLINSKKEGKWLAEEDYEVTEFSPAVQQCRLQRQAFGFKYRMDVFKDCGFIYVAKSTVPKQKDLQELITTCQGKVTTMYRNATVVVGELLTTIGREEMVFVKEAWVLDSITFNKLKPFKNYLIKSENDSPHY